MSVLQHSGECFNALLSEPEMTRRWVYCLSEPSDCTKDRHFREIKTHSFLLGFSWNLITAIWQFTFTDKSNSAQQANTLKSESTHRKRKENQRPAFVRWGRRGEDWDRLQPQSLSLLLLVYDIDITTQEIYILIYTCVCACVCVWERENWNNEQNMHQVCTEKKSFTLEVYKKIIIIIINTPKFPSS